MRKLKFYICKVLIFLLRKLYPMEFYSESEYKSLNEYIHNNVLCNLPEDTIIRQTTVVDSQLTKIKFSSLFIRNNFEYELVYSIELLPNNTLQFIVEQTPNLTLDTLINLLSFIKDNYGIHYGYIRTYFQKMVMDKR